MPAQYDFVAIGSGPAGQRGAIQAAKFGKRAALIDRRPLVGGVAVHTGTIPSKTLREAILYFTGWHQRSFYGRDYRLKPQVTIDDLMQRLDLTIRHEIAIIDNQLERNHVEVLYGTTSFIDPHRLRVERPDAEPIEITAGNILIATGTRPRRPESIPFDSEAVLDSDDLLHLKAIPKSLIVVGAGVIGAEYASMFNALDTKVTLLHERPAMLDFLDKDAAHEFLQRMHEHGMDLRPGKKIDRITRSSDGCVAVTLTDGSSMHADMLLYTAGRIGSTSALKLENAGLRVDKRHQIHVNANYQTDVPHIYAAGDVIGFPSLASTSMDQGRAAACHAFGRASPHDTTHFPYGIYTVPEISMIGETEQSLIAANIPYGTGMARLDETARGQIMGLTHGILKILFSRADRRLLGVHIVGRGATELIHIAQAVMQLKGTLDYFIENVFNYPTLAEAYKTAALDAWNRLNGSD
jgi:NAD(P) transhydrogenase